MEDEDAYASRSTQLTKLALGPQPHTDARARVPVARLRTRRSQICGGLDSPRSPASKVDSMDSGNPK